MEDVSELPSSLCRFCPLYSRLAHHVKAKGPTDAEMVLVGETPDEREVVKREPFVGPAGDMLNSLLKSAGIERSKVLVTNVLKCSPVDNTLPEGEDLQRAINCCSEILDREIKDAKIVVGLGNIPLLALPGEYSITKRRGSVYKLKEGQYFVGTLHPSFVMRSRFAKRDEASKIIPPEIVVADLKKAKRLLSGVNIPEENFIINPSSVETEEFLARVKNPEEVMGVDIETTHARIREAVPFIISFAFEDVAYCFEYEKDLEVIAEALKSPVKKVFQNGIFDVSINTNIGLEVKNWEFDTLYAHHLLYAELPHDLGFILSLYTDGSYHKHMRDNFEEGLEK